MKKVACLLLFAVFISTVALEAQERQLRALIVDGQNNHGIWPRSTIMMRQYLEDTGLYTVDIARTKYIWRSGEQEEYLPMANAGETETVETPKTDPNFEPDFFEYDVVISNFGYQAAPWPEKTKKAFENYMQSGGGFVSVHAADNSFPDWLEYNKMIGIGGWGGRTEKDGPYLYVNKLGEVASEQEPGKTGSHGSRHAFVVTMYDQTHPISRGLPQKWMHAEDEVYAQLRGPAENLSILATAENKQKGYEGRNEPMLMTIKYHDGRVFHTTLGHGQRSFECTGFITTFKRGVEWAATGSVSQTDVPKDFPGADEVSLRPFKK